MVPFMVDCFYGIFSEIQRVCRGRACPCPIDSCLITKRVTARITPTDAKKIYII